MPRPDRPERIQEYYHIVLYGENTPRDIQVGFCFAAKLSGGHHRSISLSILLCVCLEWSFWSLTCFDAPLRCALNKPNISFFPFYFSYFLFTLDRLYNLWGYISLFSVQFLPVTTLIILSAAAAAPLRAKKLFATPWFVSFPPKQLPHLNFHYCFHSWIFTFL